MPYYPTTEVVSEVYYVRCNAALMMIACNAHPYCVSKAFLWIARERCATRALRVPLLHDCWSSCGLVTTRTPVDFSCMRSTWMCCPNAVSPAIRSVAQWGSAWVTRMFWLRSLEMTYDEIHICTSVRPGRPFMGLVGTPTNDS